MEWLKLFFKAVFLNYTDLLNECTLSYYSIKSIAEVKRLYDIAPLSGKKN
ncbi:MAG: hypothetical protein JWP69_1738 [Flaviaesturariibacter sp.]|nr:hypothetical protein [Flaviaesturariibacter sp.]